MSAQLVQYPERLGQIVSFDGLQYGSITPTDIDGLIEYKNKAYAFIELKYKDAEMPYGQQLALERMVDDFTRVGKVATVFLCEHYVTDTNEEIIASESIVRSCYYRGNWVDDGERTLKERLDSFIAYAERI